MCVIWRYGDMCCMWYELGVYELYLTHWGRVTHICVSKLTNIGSDNGLSAGRRQAIIWTNAGILLFGPLGTNFSENLIGIKTFSFRKMPLKMSSAKWCPFSLGLNVLRQMHIKTLRNQNANAGRTPVSVLRGWNIKLSNSNFDWNRTTESLWVIKFKGFSRTADMEVPVIHISRVIITYTLELLSSLTLVTHTIYSLQ